MLTYPFVSSFSLFVTCCPGQIPKWVSDIFQSSFKTTTKEVIAGLKEALNKEVVTSTKEASRMNGYLKKTLK